MKIVLAIDSFKGCLTSEEVERSLEYHLKVMIPNCHTHCIPIADGGEGTLQVLMEQTEGNWHTIEAHNPRMEKVKTKYGTDQKGKTAFIEIAAISGLTLIREEQRNPMHTTTFGTGELIVDALDRGCTEFIVGLGGSATNDAGMGMLQALGYRLYNKEGRLMEHGITGEKLVEIDKIDARYRHPSLKNAHFIGACDVNNPFYGPKGATAVFARQKGADQHMIEKLDQGMRNVAEVVLRQTGKDLVLLPGSGAAGGMGGGMAAFLDAELQSGAEILLKRTDFNKSITDADLIFTGEGKADKQTLMGKIPGQILRQGLHHHIPVVLIAGQIEDKDLLRAAGFKGLFAISPDSMALNEAMKPEVAKENIRRLVAQLTAAHLKSFVG